MSSTIKFVANFRSDYESKRVPDSFLQIEFNFFSFASAHTCIITDELGGGPGGFGRNTGGGVPRI